jgi:hypothetical protein
MARITLSEAISTGSNPHPRWLPENQHWVPEFLVKNLADRGRRVFLPRHPSGRGDEAAANATPWLMVQSAKDALITPTAAFARHLMLLGCDWRYQAFRSSLLIAAAVSKPSAFPNITSSATVTRCVQSPQFLMRRRAQLCPTHHPSPRLRVPVGGE